PRMVGKRVLAVRREELDQFLAPRLREACADTDMLQRSGSIKEAQQQGTDSRTIAVFVPAKTRHDTVAVTLMLDLKHDPLIRLENAGSRLRNDSVESCALKAAKPIGRNAPVTGCRCQVDW